LESYPDIMKEDGHYITEDTLPDIELVLEND
jgi:hypothetical protein